MVTEDGLEAQLLAEVVSIERPDLETLKVKTIKSLHHPVYKLYSKHNHIR
jgi:dynein heavy chain